MSGSGGSGSIAAELAGSVPPVASHRFGQIAHSTILKCLDPLLHLQWKTRWSPEKRNALSTEVAPKAYMEARWSASKT